MTLFASFRFDNKQSFDVSVFPWRHQGGLAGLVGYDIWLYDNGCVQSAVTVSIVSRVLHEMYKQQPKRVSRLFIVLRSNEEVNTR